MNLYNLIFQMVIPFLTQPPHKHTLTSRGSRVYPIGRGSRVYPNGQGSRAPPGWGRMCSGFALPALANLINSICLGWIKKGKTLQIHSFIVWHFHRAVIHCTTFFLHTRVLLECSVYPRVHLRYVFNFDVPISLSVKWKVTIAAPSALYFRG